MKKQSQWSPYLDRIRQILESTQFNASPQRVALQINDEENLNLDHKQLDLLRTYVKRQQQKARKKIGKPKNRPNQYGVNHESSSEQKTWEESQESASYEYKGERSLTTLDEALAFSEVDLNVWEVERYVFNSWDVSMKNAEGTGAFKRTNYQVKVWFRRIEKVNVGKPEPRNIHVETTEAPQMWVIIGCVHRPFHDPVLWDKFLKFLFHNRKQITGVIVNGDFLDLRSLSSHDDYIPEGIDLSVEYTSGLQGIHEIESQLHKDIRKIFIYGNHEDRFFRDKNSIRKYGSTLQSPHEAMELPKRGWEVIEDWKNGYVTLGNNLDVFHGVKVGMNAAKDQLNALPTRSHIFNHTHRFGSYSNKTNAAYNIGCMIDFESDAFKYVDRGVRESWTHGFGVTYIDNKGANHVYPIKIDPDKSFFFQGRIY